MVKKIINFKINEKIYGVPIVISIGDWNLSREVLFKKYRLEKEKQISYGGNAEWYFEKGWSMVAIWLPEFDYNKILNIGTLSHEIDHAVQFIMDMMKIPFTPEHNNHAYIYLKEYFLEEALTRLKKLQGNKRILK